MIAIILGFCFHVIADYQQRSVCDQKLIEASSSLAVLVELLVYSYEKKIAEVYLSSLWCLLYCLVLFI